MYDAYTWLNTGYRQLQDASTLQITAANSGFISGNLLAGNRQQKGDISMVMGKFKTVQGGNLPLSQSIANFPFAGPSPALFEVVTNLKEELQRLAAASQSVEPNAGEAAVSFLARLSHSMKIPNAVMARVYGGISAEFQRIYYLIGRYMTEEEYQEIVDWEVPEDRMEDLKAMEEQLAQQAPQAEQQGMFIPPAELANKFTLEEDFEDNNCDIYPTADPSQGSETERVNRANVIADRAQQFPQIYNVREAEKDLLRVMKVTDIDSLLPPPNPNAVDPMQQMQMQYAQMEMQAAASKAKMGELREQIRLRELEHKIQMDNVRLEPEIDETISKTLKNLSDVDTREASTELNTLKAKSEASEEVLNVREEIEPSGSQGMAGSPGDQSFI